jgi:hypothetical protein
MVYADCPNVSSVSLVIFLSGYLQYKPQDPVIRWIIVKGMHVHMYVTVGVAVK